MILKILKYSLSDLLRNRWIYIYGGFYLLITLALFWLIGDHNRVMISLLNIVLVLAPLISIIFGIIYYYNSREFTDLLLSQPIKRKHIFLGQYLGVALSMSLCIAFGIGIPFLIFGVVQSSVLGDYLILLLSGVLLSLIFSALAFLIALLNSNRIRGFGLAILVWLFFAVIYDGIFLLLLNYFNDFPLEKVAIGASLFNPIDLSRILILLKLDISALMGYTGAIFEKFFGSFRGIAVSIVVLIIWILLPLWGIIRISSKRDF